MKTKENKPAIDMPRLSQNSAVRESRDTLATLNNSKPPVDIKRSNSLAFNSLGKKVQI